jgi:hypothetical protein
VGSEQDAELLSGAFTASESEEERLLYIAAGARLSGKLVGDDTLPKLVAALRRRERAVYVAAAETLADFGGVESTPVLLESLPDLPAAAAGVIRKAIRGFGLEAEPHLVDAFDHRDVRVRALAFDFIDELGEGRITERTVNGAMDVLGDSTQPTSVKARVIGLLEKILEKRGAMARDVGPLKDMLDECSAIPATHGYSFEVPALFNLLKRYDRSKVSPKTLALVGDSVSARGFDAPLMKDEALAAHRGYRFVESGRLNRGDLTVPQAKSVMGGFMSKERPELVRIAIGRADLARGRTPDHLKPVLSALVEDVLAAGAVPVLFTVPTPKMGGKRLQDIIIEYNRMVVYLSAEVGVPCVDAWRVIHTDAAAAERYFLPSGHLSKAGNELVNEKFLGLYRTLERWVMPRGAPPPREVAGAAGQGLAPAPSEANAVKNGGFEERDDRTGFALWWHPHRQDPGSVVRTSRGEAREGESSLSAQPSSRGGAAGAFTTVRVRAGTYEVRYWAIADVGKVAEVAVHVSGTDLPAMVATDQWRQFRQQVVVRTPAVNASLRIWAASPGVRVWFDEVELVFME